jgi:leucine dehydrogenase
LIRNDETIPEIAHMTAWDLPDFDDHEGVHQFRDRESGLTAVIAVHSTHLGPAAGGTRFWHYPAREAAVTDALRLSRGMSYKNAMAGLPMGGGKAVILADAQGSKTAAMITAFGRAIETLNGRYVTAEDVGMNDGDMVAIARETRHVSGLPVAGGNAGGDPGPSTAFGVFLGVKAAAKRALGANEMKNVRVAIQGVGSVGGGLARLLAAEGARLTLADVDTGRAAKLAGELGAEVVGPEAILTTDADILSPCALGAVLTPAVIDGLKVRVVAGGANNQLPTPEDGDALHARGILFAPDYVINAGGIINVVLEYLGTGDRSEVNARIGQIPARLDQVWAESAASCDAPLRVADRIAQRLIGR